MFHVKPDELKKCLVRLNISLGSLAKLIGFKKAKDISQDQARRIRALVLHSDVRHHVFLLRELCPETEFAGYRSLEPGA